MMSESKVIRDLQPHVDGRPVQLTDHYVIDGEEYRVSKIDHNIREYTLIPEEEYKALFKDE